MTMNPIKIFGREATVYFSLVAGVFQVLASRGLDLDGHVQGLVNAGIVFVFAVVTAITVHEGLIALASGITVALGSLFAAFGLGWAADFQTNVLALITVVGAFVLRKYVGAPVTSAEAGSVPGKLTS
jgi:hypothetical protein